MDCFSLSSPSQIFEWEERETERFEGFVGELKRNLGNWFELFLTDVAG